MNVPNVEESISEYKNMSEIEKKNFKIDRNLGGDKLDKIIEEADNIKQKIELISKRGDDITTGDPSQRENLVKQNELKKDFDANGNGNVDGDEDGDDDSQNWGQEEAYHSEEEHPKKEMWLEMEKDILNGDNEDLKVQLAKAKDQIIILEDDYLF